jgi:hypothetical protein
MVADTASVCVAVFKGTELLGQTETVKSTTGNFDYSRHVSVECWSKWDTPLRFVIQDPETGDDVPLALAESQTVLLSQLIATSTTSIATSEAAGSASLINPDEETVTLPLWRDGKPLKAAKVCIFKQKTK